MCALDSPTLVEMLHRFCPSIASSIILMGNVDCNPYAWDKPPTRDSMAKLRRSDAEGGRISRMNIYLCCISRHPTAAGGR